MNARATTDASRAAAPTLLLRAALLLGLIPGLTSCMGTDVGNPPQTVRTEVEFVGIEAAPAGDEPTEGEGAEDRRDPNRPAGAGFGMLHGAILSGEADLTQAWILVDTLRFRPAAECEAYADTVAPVSVAVELVSGQTYPAVPAVALEQGLYCRMEVDLAPSQEIPEGAPAALAGASILVRGVFADGSDFVLRYDRPLTLRYRADGEGLAIEESGRIFSGFRLDEWFAGEAGNAPSMPGESEVHIDPQTDPMRIEHFVSAFRASTRLHRDDNGNGRLDRDEVGRPVAASVDD